MKGPWGDGVTVTFGDGADTDTLYTLFGHIYEGYVIAVNGKDLVVKEMITDLEPGDMRSLESNAFLKAVPYNEDATYQPPTDHQIKLPDGRLYPEDVLISWDEIETIHVY